MCENQIHDTVVTTLVKETPNTQFTFLQEPISWQSAKLNDAFITGFTSILTWIVIICSHTPVPWDSLLQWERKTLKWY